MATRHEEALFIQMGACNPAGMARSLVKACDECLREGTSQQNDPAVRLIVHQIAYICGITTGAEELARMPDWDTCTKACTELANPMVQL